MELARIDLVHNQIVQDSAPWALIVQNQLPQTTWADLSSYGYPGVGYYPINIIVPTYDPAVQTLGEMVQTIDTINKQVIKTWIVTENALSAAAIKANYNARVRGHATRLYRQGKDAEANALLFKTLGV